MRLHCATDLVALRTFERTLTTGHWWSVATVTLSGR